MEPGSIEPTTPDIDAADLADGSSDAHLVRQVIAGRSEAFDQLIRKYQRQAVAVSYRLLGNSHDALEVTQDAFLKAFASIKTLQKPAAFGGWLMRIVSNLSLNYRRSRKIQTQLPLDDAFSSTELPDARSDDPVHELESREMGQRLRKAMAELPEKQRLAIVMFAIEQIPQKQVAETLGCSVEAVKWHVFQGRKKLKELMREHLQD